MLKISCPMLLLDAERNHNNLIPNLQCSIVHLTIWCFPICVAKLLTENLKLLSIIPYHILQQLKVCTLIKPIMLKATIEILDVNRK